MEKIKFLLSSRKATISIFALCISLGVFSISILTASERYYEYFVSVMFLSIFLELSFGLFGYYMDSSIYSRSVELWDQFEKKALHRWQIIRSWIITFNTILMLIVAHCACASKLLKIGNVDDGDLLNTLVGSGCFTLVAIIVIIVTKLQKIGKKIYLTGSTLPVFLMNKIGLFRN